MRRDLAQILVDEHEEIVNRWAHLLKGMKNSKYELRPLSELKRSCKECFEGFKDALTHHNFGVLREQVEKKARLRSTMGFRVSEVQQALFSFRDITAQFIQDEYKNDLHQFVSAMTTLDACIKRGIFDFTEAFQRQLASRADSYLREIEQFNRKLEHLSVTDSLTGLYNQRYFRESLKSEMARAHRYKRPLSVVLFDVDNFKRFNDTYGHLQGDEALITVARILRDGIRTVDVAARYGGEEFILVLPETDRKGALQVAEKIRANIAYYRFHVSEDKESVSFSISGGIASTEDGPSDEESLIQFADQCLYRAKKGGRNRICTGGPQNRLRPRRKTRKTIRKSA